MKNIAIIPAHGGSKRILEKNIQLFGGLLIILIKILSLDCWDLEYFGD